jgi:hypothetical protein
MPRPAFDLGLWAVCTAVPFFVAGGAFAFAVWVRGWYPGATLHLIGAGLGSLALGWGVFVALHERGVRLTGPRPDQAEDYGEGMGNINLHLCVRPPSTIIGMYPVHRRRRS